MKRRMDYKIGDGDLWPAEDMVIVKGFKDNHQTTASGIIIAKPEKEMNRGEVVMSAVKEFKPGTMIYYKYGRTVMCKPEDPKIEYVVVEKANVWCTDIAYERNKQIRRAEISSKQTPSKKEKTKEG